MRALFRGIVSFVRDECGQDTAEYSLMLVLVAIVAVAILTAFWQNITEIFGKLTNYAENGANQIQ